MTWPVSLITISAVSIFMYGVLVVYFLPQSEPVFCYLTPPECAVEVSPRRFRLDAECSKTRIVESYYCVVMD